MHEFSLSSLAQAGVARAAVRAMVIDDALSQAEIDLTEKEVQACFQAFMQSQQLRSQQEIDQWKRTNGLDDVAFKRLLEREGLWKKYCETNFCSDLSSLFLKQKEDFDSVTFSLIRVESQGVAEEIYMRLIENEDSFENLASEFSMGPEKNSRGVVGPQPLSQAHPALAELLRISVIGELWTPQKLDQWWIIVRLEARSGAELNDESKAVLAEQKGNQWLEEEINGIIEKGVLQK